MKRSQWFHPVKNPRLELDLYSHCGQAVFITIRALQNTIPFRTPAICEMVIKTFLNMAKDKHFQVYVYCLMPDHFHFIISPKEDGVSVIRFTDYFKGITTNLSWGLGWSGKLWQPRYYDHVVRTDEDLIILCDYILNNPIRKGLVESVDEWSWSAIAND